MPKTAEAPTDAQIEDHVTVQVAAQKLSTTIDRVLDAIHSGELFARNIAKGKRPAWRIPLSELRRWLASMPSPSPAPLKVAKRKPVQDVPHYFR